VSRPVEPGGPVGVGGAVRRGGHIVEPDGRVTTWSMAEGTRGRRWRWTVVDDAAADRPGAFVAAHMVELEPDGRFARLESAAGDGLLTLHREVDRSLHGNRVAEGGVDHLTLPSSAPDAIVVGSGMIGLAIASPALPADGGVIDVVEVRDDLGIAIVEATVWRDADGSIELRTGQRARRVRLDVDGLPSDDGGHSTSWPLELD